VSTSSRGFFFFVTKGFGSGSFFQLLVSPLMKSNFSLSPASYSWQPFHPSTTHCRRRNPHVQKFQCPFLQKLQKAPYFTAATHCSKNPQVQKFQCPFLQNSKAPYSTATHCRRRNLHVQRFKCPFLQNSKKLPT